MSENGFNVNAAAPSAAAEATAIPESGASQFDTDNVSGGPTDSFDQIFHGGLTIVPPPVEKYVEAVDELVRRNYPHVECGYIDGMSIARYYLVKRPDGNMVGVVSLFVQPQNRDMGDIGYRRQDTENAFRWLYSNYPGIVIADLTTILTTYAGDMERTRQGAEEIVRVLRYKADPRSLATASIFKGRTMATNYDLEAVRSVIGQFSPHGVMPRVETGAVYQTVINNNQRDFSRANSWQPQAYTADQRERPTNVVTIGGYVEIGQPVTRQTNNGPETRLEVYYHVTALYSEFAVLGMAAMALAAFSSHIINDFGWVPQFFNKKKNGDIANLVEDEDNPGHFLTSQNNDEVRGFARKMCWAPIIVLDTMAGVDIFPGLNNLTTENQKRKDRVAGYMTNFFGLNAGQQFTGSIARYAGTTLEGYYGSEDGTLRDTREFDWFKLAALSGIDVLTNRAGKIWRMLTRDDMWTSDRFKALDEHLPDVIPMVERNMHFINPKWLDYIASAMSHAGIKIQDTSTPDSYAMNVSSIGSDFIVDRVNNPTTTLFGSNDLADSDIFDVGS